MSLKCIPEWCAQEGSTHDETCPLHPFPITKGAVVDAVGIGARQAIEAYRFLVDDGVEHAVALECAIGEADESTVCWVGIGSCGRGWCKH